MRSSDMLAQVYRQRAPNRGRRGRCSRAGRRDPLRDKSPLDIHDEAGVARPQIAPVGQQQSNQ